MMVAGGPSRSIGNICLNLKHQLATGGNQITGCSILTGGKMAFINYHSKRSTGVHDFNNTLILQIHFS
jgi:hypothetical protein